jgi:nicotinamide-nucleotide adenylyltransferase
MGHVKSNVPEFDTIYTGNKFVIELVASGGTIKTRLPDFFHKKTINATNIRNRIANNKSWEELVPKPIYQIINDIKGVSRIKMLFETQKCDPVSESNDDANYYPNVK